MTENAQSNENKGSTQKTESPNVTVDEQMFCPIQLEGKCDENTGQVGQKLQELLKTIEEESNQLSRFLTDESKLISEVCTSLAMVLKKLRVSFGIAPQDIPFNRKVEKTILNEEGNLVVFYEKDEKHSAPLAEYSPEIVMAVLWLVIPELARTMSVYRKKLSVRTTFFERVKKELNAAAKIIIMESSKGNQDSQK